MSVTTAGACKCPIDAAATVVASSGARHHSLCLKTLEPFVGMQVLHHLYSRAPPALESPHVRSGLTPTQVPPR